MAYYQHQRYLKKSQVVKTYQPVMTTTHVVKASPNEIQQIQRTQNRKIPRVIMSLCHNL